MSLAGTAVFEVRTTGSDTNAGAFNPARGGGGVDYSQQDAAQYSGTNLVIDAASAAKVTSATHTFVAADLGNHLAITAGSGFTTGIYEIVSVAAGAATLDRSAGTQGSTGGPWALGGALASPGMAAGAAVASNTIWVKAGTYPITSNTQNVSGGRVTFAGKSGTATAYTRLLGYGTTRGDTSARPTLLATSGHSLSGYLVQPGINFGTVENLIIDGASLSGVNGLDGGGAATLTVRRCKIANVGTGILSVWGGVEACELTGWSTFALVTCRAVLGCYLHDSTGLGTLNCNMVVRCLAVNITGAGGAFFWNSETGLIVNCTAVSCSAGIDTQTALVAINCLAYGSTGYGYNIEGAYGVALLRNCAGGSNTSGNYRNATVESFVALTADPFVNAAGGDYSLNNTAGGGAAAKAAGIPGAFPGLGPTTGYLDLGAVQSAGGGGGGTKRRVWGN
jgi:hypothetical protein